MSDQDKKKPEIEEFDLIAFLILTQSLRYANDPDQFEPGSPEMALVDPQLVETFRADGFDFHSASNNPLLNLIAKYESGGDYNIICGGERIDLTSMTINEVLDWQKSHAGSSAAGRLR